MIQIVSILISLAAVYLGIILIAVQSGVKHFAPRQRFTTNRNAGSPDLPNLIGMILGLILLLTGAVTTMAAVSSWRPYSLDLIHLLLVMSIVTGVALLIGFIKPLTFTILRDISKASGATRILGIILIVVSTTSWLLLDDTRLSNSSPLFTNTPAENATQLPQNNPLVTVVTEELEMMARVARFNLEQIQDGATVGRSVTPISGVHQHIPAGNEVWIVAQMGGNCYPMNGPVRLEPTTGIWRHTGIDFPQPGRTYLLSLVLADNTASLALWGAIGNQQGFLCSSIKTEELTTISVTVANEE